MKLTNPQTIIIMTNLQKTTENNLQVIDLDAGQLPDLSKARELKVDLMADYWSPEKEGESKRVFFSHIAPRPVLDQQGGGVIDLECAHFIEQTKDGLKTISNGSKRLVGALENYGVQKGMPLQITYMGKKKNSTNSFQSDQWSVKPLILEG